MLYQFLQIFHCYRNSKFILGTDHLAFYSGAAVSFRIRHSGYYPSAATFQQKTRLVGGGSESRKILCIIYSQTSVPMANDDRCHSGFVFSVLYFVSLVNIFLYQILYLIIIYIILTQELCFVNIFFWKKLRWVFDQSLGGLKFRCTLSHAKNPPKSFRYIPLNSYNILTLLQN